MAFQNLHQPGTHDVAGTGVGNILAGEPDAACRAWRSGRRSRAESCLARAVATEQSDEFALANTEGVPWTTSALP